MKSSLLFCFLFLSINSFGQSATYKAWYEMSYNVNNNNFDSFKPTIADFAAKKSTIWNNVFFRYYKNSSNPMGQRDENMKFAIRNELIYSIYCPEAAPLVINLDKAEFDKLIGVEVTAFTMDKNKVSSSKVKSKSVIVTKENKQTKIEISQDAILTGCFIRIVTTVESFNFKKLGPFNFAKPTTGEYNFLLTANIPESFIYKKPEQLNLLEQETKKFIYKEFTYGTPPIVDWTVNSYTYKWTLANQSNTVLLFDLESIYFGRDVGTSEKYLMNNSK